MSGPRVPPRVLTAGAEVGTGQHGQHSAHGQNVQNGQNGHLLSTSDIEYLARHAGCGGREQIGLHYIVYIGKIPCLLSITEDNGTASLKKSGQKTGNHGCILRSGVLTRAENIKVAQCYCF